MGRGVPVIIVREVALRPGPVSGLRRPMARRAEKAR
jgi:hypothetical protein